MKSGALLIAFFLAGALFGCGPDTSETEELKNENASLKRKIATLEKELAAFQLSPDRLLAQARMNVKDKKYGDARSALVTLLEKHPTSPEVTSSKDLLQEIEAKIHAEKAAAEKAKREAEANRKARTAAAVSKMRQETDGIEGITWYHDRSTPQYADANRFCLYIGKRGNSPPFLRLEVRYVADDWLFIKSFTVVADGRKFESGPVQFERDHRSTIWEWYDVQVGSRELVIINAVVASKKATIRFYGDKYHADREISDAQKRALQNVLDAFASLGGHHN